MNTSNLGSLKKATKQKTISSQVSIFFKVFTVPALIVLGTSYYPPFHTYTCNSSDEPSNLCVYSGFVKDITIEDKTALVSLSMGVFKDNIQVTIPNKSPLDIERIRLIDNAMTKNKNIDAVINQQGSLKTFTAFSVPSR